VASDGPQPRRERLITSQSGEVAEPVNEGFLAHVLHQGVVVDDAADVGQQHVLMFAHQDLIDIETVHGDPERGGREL